MAHADGSDLIARYDSRTIGDLAADDGTRIAEGAIAANAKVLAALSGASGRVDAAVMAGGRYTAANLSGLTGDSLAHLKDIVCALAMARLFKRRPGYDEERVKLIAEPGETALKDIANGLDVFNISDHQDAGRPTIDGPSAATIRDLNLVVDRARPHVYPVRIMPRNR